MNAVGREFSVRGRFPQAEWFNSYPWLQISKVRGIVLCSWCREEIKCRVVGMSKSASSVTENGFNNWKDGSSKLLEHSLLSAHRAAAEYMAHKHKPSVAAQVCTKLAKEKVQNRKRLIAKVNSIIF